MRKLVVAAVAGLLLGCSPVQVRCHPPHRVTRIAPDWEPMAEPVGWPAVLEPNPAACAILCHGQPGRWEAFWLRLEGPEWALTACWPAAWLGADAVAAGLPSDTVLPACDATLYLGPDASLAASYDSQPSGPCRPTPRRVASLTVAGLRVELSRPHHPWRGEPTCEITGSGFTVAGRVYPGFPALRVPVRRYYPGKALMR